MGKEAKRVKAEKESKQKETKKNSGLRILGIILAIILTVLMIFILRNYYILNTYAIAMAEYGKSSNYYVKRTQYTGNNMTLSNTYYKDGKGKLELVPSETRKMIVYYDENTKESILRIDSDGDKVAVVSQNQDSVVPGIKFVSAFGGGMNAWNNFLLFFITQITTEECNGKECYRIKLEGMQVWIDKETYLTVRDMNGSSKNREGQITNIVTDYIFEFGNVTDEEVAKPDLTGYRIQE